MNDNHGLDPVTRREFIRLSVAGSAGLVGNLVLPSADAGQSAVPRPGSSAKVAALDPAAVRPLLDVAPGPTQVPYYPADGSQVPLTPPAFVWVPVPGAAGYILQFSRNPDFPPGQTRTEACAISLHVPPEALAPGRWYWRYGLKAASGEGVFSRARGFEVPADAAQVPFPNVQEVARRLKDTHPRLGVPAGQLERVRAQARGEMRWAVAGPEERAQKLIGLSLMPEPLSSLPSGGNRGVEAKKVWSATRRFFREMDLCAEAFLLAGNERCGQEARRRLMHIMAWNPNGSTSLHVLDDPGSEIPLFGARAYDYVYGLLTQEERRQCREVLVARSGQLYRSLRSRPFESDPFESHAMDYYVTRLTEACLALAGDAPVEEMLEYVLLQLWSPYYPPYGGEEGGWCEGPAYWGWSTANFLRAYAAAEQVTGVQILRKKSWFQHTLYYKLYGNPPYAKMSPFGDGQSDRPVGISTMYFLAGLFQNPYALWWAETAAEPLRVAGGLQASDSHELPWAKMAAERPSGLAAFLFPLGDLQPRPPADLPQARLFGDVGLVAMHSALADKARNVTVLMRSSPFGSISHSYADQNAFTLDAFGEPLAIASGYYDIYICPHHTEWTWQTKASNCITVAGEGQQARSPLAKGRIARFATNAYAHYALGDAQAAYAGRLKRFDRHLLFLRPRAGEQATIVIFDDLESEQPVTFEWWLHAWERMQLDGSAKTATIQRGTARLRVAFLLPQALRFEQVAGFPVAPLLEHPTQWHLTAHADKTAARQQFLTVLSPYPAGAEAELPTAQLVEGRGCRALRISTAAARHLALFREAGHTGAMEAEGLRSTAAVLAAGFDPAQHQFGSLEAS